MVFFLSDLIIGFILVTRLVSTTIIIYLEQYNRYNEFLQSENIIKINPQNFLNWIVYMGSPHLSFPPFNSSLAIL